MKKRQPGRKWANRISVFAPTEATASKQPSPCIPARSFRIRIRIQGVFLGLGRNSLAGVIAISRQPFPNRPCPSTPCVQPGLFPAPAIGRRGGEGFFHQIPAAIKGKTKYAVSLSCRLSKIIVLPYSDKRDVLPDQKEWLKFRNTVRLPG